MRLSLLCVQELEGLELLAVLGKETSLKAETLAEERNP
jgi:hypothetical protein